MRGEGIVHCSKALGTMQLMLENFDQDNTVGQISDTHNIPSFKKDVEKIPYELQKTRVFQFISGREHHSFKNPTNIIHAKQHHRLAFVTFNSVKCTVPFMP